MLARHWAKQLHKKRNSGRMLSWRNAVRAFFCCSGNEQHLYQLLVAYENGSEKLTTFPARFLLLSPVMSETRSENSKRIFTLLRQSLIDGAEEIFATEISQGFCLSFSLRQVARLQQSFSSPTVNAVDKFRDSRKCKRKSLLKYGKSFHKEGFVDPQ